MRKILVLFAIPILVSNILLVNTISYAEERCSKERQNWIKHLKSELEKDIEDVQWEDDLCYATVSKVKGKPIKEYLASIESEISDIKKMYSIDEENWKPLDINWVPEEFKNK